MARRAADFVMAIALCGVKHRTRSRAVQYFWVFYIRSWRALAGALWQVAVGWFSTRPLRTQIHRFGESSSSVLGVCALKPRPVAI